MSVKSKNVMLRAVAGGLLCAAAAAVLGTGTARATPGFQFNTELLARSYFQKLELESPRGAALPVEMEIKRPADVYVVRNTVPAGGYSGWHTHPGPSIVLVSAGTATVYDGDDPSCTPKTYPAGSAFVDSGNGHVHMVRNEGAIDLVTVAFQMVPATQPRRIDAPNPGYCGF
jgi:quercetin dioxygenase-like cupin family protein